MGTFRFRISGSIRDGTTREPLEGLVVRAYDKDLAIDDHLGDAVTDASGRFHIQFTALGFQDLFEQRPDLYLRVFDGSGSVELHSTEREVRQNAKGDEHFDIRITRR